MKRGCSNVYRPFTRFAHTVLSSVGDGTFVYIIGLNVIIKEEASYNNWVNGTQMQLDIDMPVHSCPVD